VDSTILPSILSDHSPIAVTLKYIPDPTRGPGQWKLNVSLLKEEDYKIQLKHNIADWLEKYKDLDNDNLKWDLMKYEIRKFSITYCKKKKKQQIDEKVIKERQLIELEQIENQANEETLRQRDILKADLEKIHLNEAQGAIIRSRVQWSEEGEKSNAYFFNLEKQNAIKKSIRRLVYKEKEITNPDDILTAMKEYYEEIYGWKKIDFSKTEIFSNAAIPKLNREDQEKCEGLISLDECSKVLHTMAKNKTPGNDGLQVEFYIEFWKELGPLLIKSYNYSFTNGLLSTSQRQACISLLSKNGKDRLFIDNWRPISLLNVDYKIMSKCIAERIKKVLVKLIDETQTGFIKGRNISDGMRAILDIVEETVLSNRDGMIITVDFQKAFDSLSWEYLFKALQTFKFGTDFIKWVKLCYTDISSCIMNNKSSSQYFNIKRGVRQGDPLSPYLFILAVELMSVEIRTNKEIRGLLFGDREIKIISYADDTTAILRDETDAIKLFEYLKQFEEISGLKVNKTKTEGLWLGARRGLHTNMFGIKWPQSLKILGIYVSYDEKSTLNKNFRDKIDKMTKKLNSWKQRHLTIFGKILILKTFALTQFLYVSSVLHVPNDIIKEIEDLMFKFLWNGRQHKVKKKVIVQSYELGGCKMIDLTEMLKVQKLKWIKKLFDETNMPWKHTMETIFKVKDLKLFLKSNFPFLTRITNFYKDVLRCWDEIRYKTIESVEDIINQYIWYNDKILVEKKPIFSEYLKEAGIFQIGHIIKNNGCFKSFNEICTEFGINRSYFLTYIGIIKSIPPNWKRRLKEQEIRNNVEITKLCFININNKKQELSKVNHKQIYEQLIVKKIEYSKAFVKYSEQFKLDLEQWKKIYMLPFNLQISNKAKEMNYKILHNFVATNKLLYKIGKVDSPRCNFCQLYDQDTQHLFYHCMVVRNFWFRVVEYLNIEHDLTVNISLEDILFGHASIKGNNIINKTIMLGKLYVYFCKTAEKELIFEQFKMRE